MPSNLPTQQSKLLTGHKGPVHALTYSSPTSGSSTYLLTGSTDRSIRLFNVVRKGTSTPSAIQTFQGHGHEVLDIAITSDNTRFASCGGDKLIFLWDVPNAQILRRIAGHAGRVNCVAWAGVGDSVMVSGK
jgi:mitogen-activated protein kinase organizer 1